MFLFTFTGCDITPSFLTYQRSFGRIYGAITETFSKLSWTPDKVKENDLNLIEKYVCTAYDLHNRFHTNDINRLRLLLFTESSENILRKLPLTRYTLQLRGLRSV